MICPASLDRGTTQITGMSHNNRCLGCVAVMLVEDETLYLIDLEHASNRWYYKVRCRDVKLYLPPPHN